MIPMRKEVLEAVDRERQRQDVKWGWPQDHSLPEWATILGEEFGEACQDVLRVNYGGMTPERLDALVAEVIQVAGVAVAIVEHLIHEGDLDVERLP